MVQIPNGNKTRHAFFWGQLLRHWPYIFREKKTEHRTACRGWVIIYGMDVIICNFVWLFVKLRRCIDIFTHTYKKCYLDTMKPCPPTPPATASLVFSGRPGFLWHGARLGPLAACLRSWCNPAFPASVLGFGNEIPPWSPAVLFHHVWHHLYSSPGVLWCWRWSSRSSWPTSDSTTSDESRLPLSVMWLLM